MYTDIVSDTEVTLFYQIKASHCAYVLQQTQVINAVEDGGLITNTHSAAPLKQCVRGKVCTDTGK